MKYVLPERSKPRTRDKVKILFLIVGKTHTDTQKKNKQTEIGIRKTIKNNKNLIKLLILFSVF